MSSRIDVLRYVETRQKLVKVSCISVAVVIEIVTGPLEVVSLMQIASNVAHGGSNIRELLRCRR